jgi:hypothetical protein
VHKLKFLSGGLFGGFGEDFFADILEDDTTKKPTVAPVPSVVGSSVVTSAPIIADKPAVIEPVKAPVIIPVEATVNDVVPVEANEIVAPIENVVQSDEKIAEPAIEAETMMPLVPEKNESTNEIVSPIESDSTAPVETVATEVISQAPISDTPAIAPTKATSEEEGLLEGIINTLTFDDAEDDDGK